MSFNLLQLQSLATAELGNAIGTYVLAKVGAPAVPGLTSLAADLPQIPLGKLTPVQLGTLSAQLSKIQGQMQASQAAGESVGTPPVNLSQTLSQLGSLISLVSSSEATATGGLETADQAIAVQYLANVSQGLANALGLYAGQQAAV